MTDPGPPGMNRLLLVDDHTIVREGMKRILDTSGSPWTITEAGTGQQALQYLRQQPYRMVIMDLSMPGISGLDLVRRIKSEFSDVAVLVLSMHAEEQYALRSLRAGANGYVTKDSAAEELVAAVRKVSAGGNYVTVSLAERVVQQLSGAVEPVRHSLLSNREMEVMRRIVAGQRPAEIAKELHLSVKTVSSHKSHILEKLQLSSEAALIKYGLEHRIGQGDGLPGANEVG
jgi:DNA-binding NarL/FixJ family response regulator